MNFDDASIAELRSRVAANPQDAATRLSLVEAFLVRGSWPEARREVELLRGISPEMDDYVEDYLQLIDAEIERHAGKSETFADSPEALIDLVELAKSDLKSEDILDRLEEVQSRFEPVRGHIDGRELFDIHDIDDVLNHVIELFCDGHCYWVPWQSIRKLRLGETKTLRDRLYIPATLTTRTGESIAIYLPSRYTGTTQQNDPDFLLAEAIDLIEHPNGVVRAIGCREFVVDDGREHDEISIFDFRQIEFKSLSIL